MLQNFIYINFGSLVIMFIRWLYIDAGVQLKEIWAGQGGLRTSSPDIVPTVMSVVNSPYSVMSLNNDQNLLCICNNCDIRRLTSDIPSSTHHTSPGLRCYFLICVNLGNCGNHPQCLVKSQIDVTLFEKNYFFPFF